MDEREKILQMLKDGVITVPEATTLLDAITDDPRDAKKSCKDRNKDFQEAQEELREKLKKLNDRLSRVGEDVTIAVSDALKKVDAKLNKKRNNFGNKEYEDE
jgi:DNA-binding transcriptional MerR regulator